MPLVLKKTQNITKATHKNTSVQANAGNKISQNDTGKTI